MCPQMHTRCLTAVDLAEHVALQIQFQSLAVKATSDTDLMDISFPSVARERRARIKYQKMTFYRSHSELKAVKMQHIHQVN